MGRLFGSLITFQQKSEDNLLKTLPPAPERLLANPQKLRRFKLKDRGFSGLKYPKI
jgi:hypothetical protein